MKLKKLLTVDVWLKLHQLHLQGVSKSDLADMFGVSEMTVYRWLKKDEIYSVAEPKRKLITNNDCMIFVGDVKEGKLVMRNPEEFYDHLGKLRGLVEVRVTKPRDIRSFQQNAYYWSILAYISDFTGEDKLTLHETFKSRFLRDEGKLFEIVKSTTKITTKEFAEYMEQIRTFMLGYDVVLPKWEKDEYDEVSAQETE